jgi:hypothetical protein
VVAALTKRMPDVLYGMLFSVTLLCLVINIASVRVVSVHCVGVYVIISSYMVTSRCDMVLD